MKRSRWNRSGSEDNTVAQAKVEVKIKSSPKQASLQSISTTSSTTSTSSSSSPPPPSTSSPPLPLTALPLHPLLSGCRDVSAHYTRISHIDSGTYGIVWKSLSKETNTFVALKQVKFDSSSEEGDLGFPISCMREINILMKLRHENIVNVKEMVVGEKVNSVFMVMEFMECDLQTAVRDLTEVMTQGEVKQILLELTSAVAYMHSSHIFHRDLKTSNVLVHSSGKVSICDFGLSRKYDTPLRNDYTQMVVSLWYRCPELLLGEKVYGPEIDMWSLGCIFGELLMLETVFEGEGEVDQLSKIFKVLGVQSEATWPGFNKLPHSQTLKFKGPQKSKLRTLIPSNSFSGKTYLDNSGFDLLARMLSCDPKGRISGVESLTHKYFLDNPKASDVNWNWNKKRSE